MSAGTPRAFLPLLRELEREMAIPVPDRLRILQELEFDLEHLRRHLEQEGLPVDEARAKALEALAPGHAALAELRRLHTPAYERLVHRVGEARLRLWERGTLVGATLVVLVGALAGLLRADLLSNPSPFLWPVLALGAGLFWTTARRVSDLWIKGRHDRLDRGAGPILLLAGTTLLVGIGGTMIDLYRLAARLEAAPALAGPLATEWLVRDAALLAVSTVAALAGGLAWFFLTQWLTHVSAARAELLGLPSSRPPSTGTTS